MTVRELVNIPANLLYPESFAEQVRNLVRGSKIIIDVLDETALSEGGYGGLMVWAVDPHSRHGWSDSATALEEPGSISPVGKGITFDTGGLNLKPAECMYTMKCDMAGAATVLVARRMINRQLGLKIRVTAYGALAENMPSGSAFRPSDVLTIYGGKTVENGNS